MQGQQGEEKPAEGQGKAQEGQNEPDVLALTNQLKSEKEARRAAQGKLADLEVRLKEFEGIDPAQVREIIAEKQKLEEEMRKKDPAKLEEYHKIEKQKLAESYDRKLAEALAKVEQLQKVNKTLTVTDKVMAQIGKHFSDDVQDIVKGIVERHCDIDESGQIYIRDENGEEMMSPKNKVLPITVEEFGQWLVEKRPSLARPVGMGGTGSPAQGERTRRGQVRIPTTMAELQSLPNAKEVWASLTAEEKAKLGSTWKL